MSGNSAMRRLLYCQRCGESQIADAHVTPCRCCGCVTFHRDHPSRRDPHWIAPGYTAADRKWLREMRIAIGELRFEAMPGEHGWWLVVDRARGAGADATNTVRYFSPHLPDPEQEARMAAEHMNRDALWRTTREDA